MRLKRVGAGVAVLAVAMLMATPARASAPLPDRAVDPGTASGAAEAVASAYRAAYPAMSVAAARTAAAQQAQRRLLHDTVEGDPKTFGGSWFDAPSGVLHVAVTTAGAEATATTLGHKLGIRVQTHRVARTFADLERQAAAIRRGTGALSAAAAGNVGLDLVTNQVVVAVPALRMAALAADAVPAGVRVAPRKATPVEPDVCTARNNCADSLRAGLMLSPQCSLGFTFRDKFTPNTRWVITAGHCSTGVGVTWSTGGTTIGTLTGATDRDNLDIASISTTNATYLADTVGRIYMHGAANRFVRVNGAPTRTSSMVAGDVVCLSANITTPTGANNCAVIELVSDPQVRGMVKTTGYDACGGDSGGGWYQLTSDNRRNAYGIHSRSTTGCNATPAESWFTPVPGFTGGMTIETG
ncbi:trypsin-like serine protease [Actinoplanes sp. NPDC049599]|uniref:trypsin-like serine protease n=1 Tax=Actinoplanes sp. NPDC049599 TaxID=3363903 RepID=UPI0037BBEC7D